MQQKNIDKTLEKACKLFDKKEYDNAEKYFYQALKENDRISDFIYYYLSSIEVERRCYQEAYNMSLKACEAVTSGNSLLAEKFSEKIFRQHGGICFYLGIVWESALYFYKAYQMTEDVKTKKMSLGSCLMSMVASNALPEEILIAAKEYNRMLHENIDCSVRTWTKKQAGDKIHVAYMSPDYRYHVMYSFYYHLLEKYNKNEFMITCVSLNEKRDKYTDKVRTLPVNFVDLSGLEIEVLAEKLLEMDIDILVDLAGHSANSGMPVFAYRVAPVQISGLGWMETTGLSSADYLMTDKYLDPLGQSYILEKPMYLTSQFCYRCYTDIAPSTGAPCIENGYITFGTFNRINKFTQEMLETWRKILFLVPKSKLLLKCSMFSSSSNIKMIRKRFLQAGLDNNRIIIEPPSFDYLESYRKIDIALDTYPYTGGGTTFDALYMGVPVVSMYGERRSSRFGLSILSNAGVGELAVNTEKEYIERAVSLANDWETLDLLHKNLRTIMQNSPAMDGEGYVREIEAQYKKVLAEALK